MNSDLSLLLSLFSPFLPRSPFCLPLAGVCEGRVDLSEVAWSSGEEEERREEGESGGREGTA